MEVRRQVEDWGWLHEHRLKGASAPQLAGRESGRKSGPAEEARDHCFGVCEERGFLLCATKEGRAKPKRAQRWARAAANSLDPRDRHETLRLPLLPPRILCASTGHTHNPHNPSTLGACAARHCQGPKMQGQLPRKNTQCASGCCHVSLCHHRLTLHSNHDYCTLPLPGLSEQEHPNQPLLQPSPVWVGTDA